MSHYDKQEEEWMQQNKTSRIDVIGQNGGDGLHYKKDYIVPEIMKDLTERMAKGTQEYGTPLHTHNGRNALQDAYEEVLDLACYLKQRMMEEGK